MSGLGGEREAWRVWDPLSRWRRAVRRCRSCRLVAPNRIGSCNRARKGGEACSRGEWREGNVFGWGSSKERLVNVQGGSALALLPLRSQLVAQFQALLLALYTSAYLTTASPRHGPPPQRDAGRLRRQFQLVFSLDCTRHFICGLPERRQLPQHSRRRHLPRDVDQLANNALLRWRVASCAESGCPS